MGSETGQYRCSIILKKSLVLIELNIRRHGDMINNLGYRFSTDAGKRPGY
jgi:hypothetical protein